MHSAAARRQAAAPAAGKVQRLTHLGQGHGHRVTQIHAGLPQRLACRGLACVGRRSEAGRCSRQREQSENSLLLLYTAVPIFSTYLLGWRRRGSRVPARCQAAQTPLAQRPARPQALPLLHRQCCHLCRLAVAAAAAGLPLMLGPAAGCCCCPRRGAQLHHPAAAAARAVQRGTGGPGGAGRGA